MCDYSLEQVASRSAVKGERLITSRFPKSITRGFSSVSDPNTAVCLLPGTEVVFDAHPRLDRFWMFGSRVASSKTARFRQINLQDPHCHHDALEFSDGATILLDRVKPGQIATVIQLPRSDGLIVRGDVKHHVQASSSIT